MLLGTPYPPRAIFFDLADTLGYLWVPKHQRFLFLWNTAGVPVPSREAGTAGTLAFLRTLAQEEPGPVVGSLGWRGSLASYAAGFKAMGLNDADALAQDLVEVARSLHFVIFPDPAAERVLGNLKANGFRLGVISNHRGTLKENLEELGLRRPRCSRRRYGARPPDRSAQTRSVSRRPTYLWPR